MEQRGLGIAGCRLGREEIGRLVNRVALPELGDDGSACGRMIFFRQPGNLAQRAGRVVLRQRPDVGQGHLLAVVPLGQFVEPASGIGGVALHPTPVLRLEGVHHTQVARTPLSARENLPAHQLPRPEIHHHLFMRQISSREPEILPRLIDMMKIFRRRAVENPHEPAGAADRVGVTEHPCREIPQGFAIGGDGP